VTVQGSFSLLDTLAAPQQRKM